MDPKDTKKAEGERLLHDAADAAEPIPDASIAKEHAQILREKREPMQNLTPIPMALLLVCAVLLFWGGFYLARYSGDFESEMFNPDLTLASMAGSDKPYDPIAHGAKIFKGKGNCVTCHQENGQGLPNMYPPLDGSPWVTEDPERMVKILVYGLNGPIEVLGNTYDGNMPAIGAFKDKEIAAVASYVRQAWSNKAEPIDEALVLKVRTQVGDRAQPFTVSEL